MPELVDTQERSDLLGLISKQARELNPSGKSVPLEIARPMFQALLADALRQQNDPRLQQQQALFSARADVNPRQRALALAGASASELARGRQRLDTQTVLGADRFIGPPTRGNTFEDVLARSPEADPRVIKQFTKTSINELGAQAAAGDIQATTELIAREGEGNAAAIVKAQGGTLPDKDIRSKASQNIAAEVGEVQHRIETNGLGNIEENADRIAKTLSDIFGVDNTIKAVNILIHGLPNTIIKQTLRQAFNTGDLEKKEKKLAIAGLYRAGKESGNAQMLDGIAYVIKTVNPLLNLDQLAKFEKIEQEVVQQIQKEQQKSKEKEARINQRIQELNMYQQIFEQMKAGPKTLNPSTPFGYSSLRTK